MAVRRTRPLGGPELLGEYPFLPGAEALVAELAPSLGDLLADPVYARARELGRARVRTALADPSGTTGVGELARATPEERFLSFTFARLLVSASFAPAAVRRWAVAEAKQGYGRWRGAPAEELREVARRLEFPIEPDGDFATLAVPDYVRLATPIREGDFRLAQQAVRAGRVRVGRDRAARLLQEAVRLSLTAPIALDDEVRRTIVAREASFLAEIAERIPAPPAAAGGPAGPVDPARFPPCIRKMRRMLEAGENLSHAGRFALAAFLHRAGVDAEGIVDAYRGAPDFDESITRYQVEHITQRDGGRGYTPPECETLRSHGLCFWDGDPGATALSDRGADLLCHRPVRSPLQYYRIRGGRVIAEAPDGPDRAPSTPATPGRPPSPGPRG
ncbi:MAG TPA: hypothetical protein VMH78_05505 [Thermoplasmata archaeon]|nr:hypothetical protein [Thermoplasmata archaeon]